MMTMECAQALFCNHSVADALNLLREEAARNGWDESDYMNAGSLQLINLATSTNGNKSIVVGSGGVGNGVVSTCGNAEPGGNGNGEPQVGNGEGNEPTQGGNEPQNGEGEEGNEPQSGGEPSGEPSAEPQKQKPDDGKKHRNTPSWKAIAEEQKAKSEELKKEMQKQMDEMKSAMQKQLDDAKAQSSEPQSAEDAEARAEELMQMANKMREEAKRKAEEEAKAKAKASANQWHKQTEDVLLDLRALGICYLVGPAGTGKTTLAIDICRRLFNIETREEAKASKLFSQISFDPSKTEGKIIGYKDANGIWNTTQILEVYRNGGICLFDEIDAGDASLLTCLHTMIDNGMVSTTDGIVKRNPHAYFVLTANTIGTGANSQYTARSRLDFAFLDRVNLAMTEVDYDPELEKSISSNISVFDPELEAELKEKKGNGLPPAEVKWVSDVMAIVRKTIKENTSWKRLMSTRFDIQASQLLRVGRTHQYIIDKWLISCSDNHMKQILRNVMMSVK